MFFLVRTSRFTRTGGRTQDNHRKKHENNKVFTADPIIADSTLLSISLSSPVYPSRSRSLSLFPSHSAICFLSPCQLSQSCGSIAGGDDSQCQRMMINLSLHARVFFDKFSKTRQTPEHALLQYVRERGLSRVQCLKLVAMKWSDSYTIFSQP